MYFLEERRLKKIVRGEKKSEAVGRVSSFKRSRHPFYKAYFGLLARNQPIFSFDLVLLEKKDNIVSGTRLNGVIKHILTDTRLDFAVYFTSFRLP